MNDKTNQATQNEQDQIPNIRVLNQYIRDLSFENIAAQKNLGSTEGPEINVGVNLDARKGEENNYEVIMRLTVTAKDQDQDIFLIELDYGGIFNITNIPDDQIHPFLMIECPRLLFPFIRQIIRDIAINGGFPPLNIDPIDFVGLYRNEMERRAAEAQENKGE